MSLTISKTNTTSISWEARSKTTNSSNSSTRYSPKQAKAKLYSPKSTKMLSPIISVKCPMMTLTTLMMIRTMMNNMKTMSNQKINLRLKLKLGRKMYLSTSNKVSLRRAKSIRSQREEERSGIQTWMTKTTYDFKVAAIQPLLAIQQFLFLNIKQKKMMYNRMKNYYDKKLHCRSNTIKQKQPSSLLSGQQSSIIERGKIKLNISMLSDSKKYSTIDLSRKMQKILVSKAALQVQETIKKQLRGQLSEYLSRKFKHFLNSKDTLESSSYADLQFANPESRISKLQKGSNDLYECKGCIKLVKKQNFSQQLKIAHARQKILRLIEMKHNKEKEFNQYQETLKTRSLRTQKQRRRNTYLEVIKNQQNGERWNEEWARQHTSQLMRYRTRVMKKNQKYKNGLMFHSQQ